MLGEKMDHLTTIYVSALCICFSYITRISAPPTLPLMLLLLLLLLLRSSCLVLTFNHHRAKERVKGLRQHRIGEGRGGKFVWKLSSSNCPNILSLNRVGLWGTLSSIETVLKEVGRKTFALRLDPLAM